VAAVDGDGGRDGDADAYSYAHEGRRYICAHLEAHPDRDADVDIPARADAYLDTGADVDIPAHPDAYLDVDADADAPAHAARAGFYPLFRNLACGDLARSSCNPDLERRRRAGVDL